MITRRNGFTLIELLIAMGITSVLMLTLLSILSQASEHYTQTNRAINSLSQARAFFQFFERELRAKLPDSELLIEKIPRNESIAYVRVISPEEENPNTTSDLQLTRYHIAMTQDDAGHPFPALIRSVYSPGDAQAFLEQGNAATLPTNDPLSEETIIPHILHFSVEPIPSSTGSANAMELSFRLVDESAAQRYKTAAEWQRLASSPRSHELPFIRTYRRLIPLTP
jgi:prepilin-type N-terminal cleavage/methylation domain-containing protein